MSRAMLKIDARYKPSILLSLLVIQLICAASVVTVYASVLTWNIDQMYGIAHIILGSVSVVLVVAAFSLYLICRLSPKYFLISSGATSCLWVGDITYNAIRMRYSPEHRCLSSVLSDTTEIVICRIYWCTFAAGGLILLDYITIMVYCFSVIMNIRRERRKRISQTVIITLPPPGTPPINIPRMMIVDYGAGKMGGKKIVKGGKKAAERSKLPLIGLTPATPNPSTPTPDVDYEEQPEEFYKNASQTAYPGFPITSHIPQYVPSHFPPDPNNPLTSLTVQNASSAASLSPMTSIPEQSPLVPPRTHLVPTVTPVNGFGFVSPTGPIRRISSAPTMSPGMVINPEQVSAAPGLVVSPTTALEVSPTISLASQNFDSGVQMQSSPPLAPTGPQAHQSLRGLINNRTNAQLQGHARKSSGLREVYTAGSDVASLSSGGEEDNEKSSNITSITEKWEEREYDKGKEKELEGVEYLHTMARHQQTLQLIQKEHGLKVRSRRTSQPLLEQHPALRRHSDIPRLQSITPLRITKALPPLPTSASKSTATRPNFYMDPLRTPNQPYQASQEPREDSPVPLSSSNQTSSETSSLNPPTPTHADASNTDGKSHPLMKYLRNPFKQRTTPTASPASSPPSSTQRPVSLPLLSSLPTDIPVPPDILVPPIPPKSESRKNTPDFLSGGKMASMSPSTRSLPSPRINGNLSERSSPPKSPSLPLILSTVVDSGGYVYDLPPPIPAMNPARRWSTASSNSSESDQGASAGEAVAAGGETGRRPTLKRSANGVERRVRRVSEPILPR